MGTKRDDVGGGEGKSQRTRKASFASAAASAVAAAASAAATNVVDKVKTRAVEAAEKKFEERKEELQKAVSNAAEGMARRASRVASTVATGLHKAYERGIAAIEKIGQAIDQISAKKIDESIDRVIDQIDTIGTVKTEVGKDIGGASRNALSPTDIEALTDQFVSLVDLTLAKRKMALNGEGKQSAKEFFRRNYDPSAGAKPGQVQDLFNQYIAENFPNEERAKRVSVRMSEVDLVGKLKQLEIERDAALKAAAEAQRQLQDMLAGAMKASNESAGDDSRVIQLMQQLQSAQEKLDRMVAGGRSSVRTTSASSSVEAVGVDDKLVKAKKAVGDVLNDPTMKFKGKEELTAAERQAIIEQIGSSVAKMGIDNSYLILNMIVKLKAGGIHVADPSLKTTGGVQERAVVEERPVNPLLEQLKERQAKLGAGSSTTTIDAKVKQQREAAALAAREAQAAGGMEGSSAFKAALAKRRTVVQPDDSDDEFDEKHKKSPSDRSRPGGS